VSDSLVDDLRERIAWIDGHADVWAVFADAALLDRCVEAIVGPFRDDGITHVVAVESRGFILGGAAAVAIGAGFVGIRKASGHLPGDLLLHDGRLDYAGRPTRLRLQRSRLTRQSRVLVVDDWFETGAQFDAARTLVESTGATVVGASLLIDQTSDDFRASTGGYRYVARAAELDR
jgi:adenine phosphoribosyltransferase